MSKGKSLLAGFLIGGAVSAATVLLTAPSSGRELRAKAKNQTEYYRNKLDVLLEEGVQIKDQVLKTSKEGVVLLKDLSSDVRSSIEGWKSTIEPHQRNIEKHLKEIEESLKELEKQTKSEEQI
ncbi:YtxH domain-containing protein [Bacillaceae bacterium S4-13-58]